jgi:hypothetical protein
MCEAFANAKTRNILHNVCVIISEAGKFPAFGLKRRIMLV